MFSCLGRALVFKTFPEAVKRVRKGNLWVWVVDLTEVRRAFVSKILRGTPTQEYTIVILHFQ